MMLHEKQDFIYTNDVHRGRKAHLEDGGGFQGRSTMIGFNQFAK